MKAALIQIVGYGCVPVPMVQRICWSGYYVIMKKLCSRQWCVLWVVGCRLWVVIVRVVFHVCIHFLFI